MVMLHFGENKVQEAAEKWTEIKEKKFAYKTSFNWKTTNK